MSFSVALQVNSSEPNKIGKNISGVMTLSGVLKNETSIINPVILVAASADDLAGCNYMTIGIFNRKYFITDIKSVRAGLTEIYGHVDVLDSFAGEIKACTAIIRKQETANNLYLNDGTFKVYQNPEVITKSFPSGFSSRSYVLALAGS